MIAGKPQDQPNNGDNNNKDNGNGDNNSSNGGNNSGNVDTSKTGFPDNIITISNPKYGKLNEADYDESTVPEGKTRILFETDGGEWKYPVSFEVDNGTLFSTFEAPKKEGYEFVGWDKDWKVSDGKVIAYKAKWLRKEVENNSENNSGNSSSNNNNGNNNQGSNTGRYTPNTTNNSGNNANGSDNTRQYIYNGKVLTGNPNNNSVNLFNSTNLRGANANDPLRQIGLETLNDSTGNNGTNSTNIAKVDKNLPKTGENNIKVVMGIFAITILIGIMYIYRNKLGRIDRKTGKNIGKYL